ncbi:MAG: T9SS type A sorting domain-containing protein [Salinibacter sp.]
MSGYGASGSSDPTLTNVLLYGNTASVRGDQIANTNADPTIRYSLVENGTGGIYDNGSSTTYEASNVEADPQFVESGNPEGADGTLGSPDDGLRLAPGSPAFDAGDNDAIPSGISEDITGATRTQDQSGNGTATVNIGAYEVDTGTTSPLASTTGSQNVTGTSATIAGTASAAGLETTVQVQYFPTAAPSDVTTVTASASPLSTDDFTTRDVSVALSGLQPDTEYDARILASNSSGSEQARVVFTTDAGYTRTISGQDGTGNDAGWRMLALPAAGKARSALEDDLTFATNSGSILYRWTSGSWTAQTSSGDALPRGKGFMLYFFDDVIDPIGSEGLPIATSTGGEDQSSNTQVTGLGQSKTFHLVGNPFDVAFDLSELNLSAQGFQTSVQIWDPSSQSYTTVTQSDDDSDVIGAWQGFFVERSTQGEGGTSLTFPTAGKQSGDGDLIGSQSAHAVAEAKSTNEHRLRLDLRLAAIDTTGRDASPPSPSTQMAPQVSLARPPAAFDTIEGSAAKTQAAAQSSSEADTIATGQLGLLLSESASAGWDGAEATQVDPPGGGPPAVTLSSPLKRSSDASPLPQRALASEPYPSGNGSPSAVTLPVSAQVPEGSYAAGATARVGLPEARREELSWQLPEGWALRLTDTQTGEHTDLLSESYAFTLKEGMGTDLESASGARFRLAVGPRSALPVEGGLSLKAPYPNPATRRATVEYAVPQQQAGGARLELYDVLGRRVRTVAVKPGPQTRRLDVSGLASGTYILRLTTGGTQQTRNLTVVR